MNGLGRDLCRGRRLGPGGLGLSLGGAAGLLGGGFGGRVDGRLGGGSARTRVAFGHGPGVSQRFDDAQHFRPRKEQFVVVLLVLLDGMQEINLVLTQGSRHGAS